MQQILKRLDLIKTCIALEDEELIELQVCKIKSLDYDNNIANILHKLEMNDFSDAVSAIENYINKQSGLIPYEDKEAQGLKLELKVLERKLQNLTEQKNDCIIDIDDFNREYSLKLGAVTLKILHLREEMLYQQVIVKEQAFQSRKEEYDKAKGEVENIKKQIEELEGQLENLDEFSDEYDEHYAQYQKLNETLNEKELELNKKRKEAKRAKEELDSDPVNEEYKEAKEDSETFEKEHEEVKAEESYDLNTEQLKELKALYRKACRLCHPDIVADELKDQAHKIMSELNAAKKKNNLEKVKEILYSLQSRERFDTASDTIYDKDLLKTKIINIKNKIELLQTEIHDLEISEAYKIIKGIDDRNEYFDEVNSQLVEELEQLEKELRQLKNPLNITL